VIVALPTPTIAMRKLPEVGVFVNVTEILGLTPVPEAFWTSCAEAVAPMKGKKNAHVRREVENLNIFFIFTPILNYCESLVSFSIVSQLSEPYVLA
jgi:hypothetical protein